MNRISEERLQKYKNITKEALEEAALNIDSSKAEALDFLDMAQRYYSDALFFEKKGDIVTAFAALNYSHGWLDAGARIKFFKVKNNRLFTVD